MNKEQRAAALRLANEFENESYDAIDVKDVAALLRELASEPQAEPMPGMSLMNRTIAYCAADTLRKLGYEWNGEAWLPAEPVQEPPRADCPDCQGSGSRDSGGTMPWGEPVYLPCDCSEAPSAEPVQEPVRECADNDSPWLVCKTCAAVGRCAKLPVAWRSKERINGEFDSGWKLTSNEPPQTPRTIAIEPLYAHPPQQRKPLTDEQIDTAWLHRDYIKAIQAGDIMAQVRCVVRAIERFHGIGDKE